MSKKPYIHEGLEWLETTKKVDWNDPVANPDDIMPYSEFQKPYLDKDGDNSYPSWEWTIDPTTWPPIEDVTFPDPVPHPCNVEDNCRAVGIIGPNELDCGKCYTYTHVHVVESCELQWWMAYGNWYIKGDPGFASQLFESPIMTTVCAADDAQGVITLVYEGPLGCDDQIDITIGCDQCCEDMELTGSDTVNSGDTWIGTISPACPDLDCSVTSNSGCSIGCLLNATGSQVQVGTDEGDCGSFTVIISQDIGGDCAPVTTSKTVRLSEGNWEPCNALTFGGEHQCYGNLWIEGEYKATVDCGTGGWGFINARDCENNIIHRFDYEPDCCDGCGSCYTQHFTRGYTSLVWSCTC